MKSKVRGYIGLAARGGNLLYGETLFYKSDRCKLVFLASDASEQTKEKVRQLVNRNHLPCLEIFSKEELGHITGKNQIAILGLSHQALARQILQLLKESDRNGSEGK